MFSEVVSSVEARNDNSASQQDLSDDVEAIGEEHTCLLESNSGISAESVCSTEFFDQVSASYKRNWRKEHKNSPLCLHIVQSNGSVRNPTGPVRTPIRTGNL